MKPLCPTCGKSGYVVHRTGRHNPPITIWECLSKEHSGQKFATHTGGRTVYPPELLDEVQQLPHEHEGAGGTVENRQIVRFLCGLCRLDIDAAVHVDAAVRLARARVVEAAKAWFAYDPGDLDPDLRDAVAELDRLEAEAKP